MKHIFTICLLLFVINSYSQESTTNEIISYKKTKDYTIADIKVTGVKFLNPTHLVSISGLAKGQKISIPGNETSEAIKKYWKYGLFSDVELIIDKIEDDKVYLIIELTEQPRLNNLVITGIKKGESEDIKEKLNLNRGTQVTDNILNDVNTIISRHYKEKGFFNVDIDIKQEPDSTGKNQIDLLVDINKNKKVKITEIVIEGNEAFPDKKLRRKMKNTKQIDWNIFKGSKYIEEKFSEDKVSLIDFYNKHGYSDAIIGDISLTEGEENRLLLKINIFEGKQYYIRNLEWVGNTKYPSEYLGAVLGIKEGDLYDKKLLSNRLSIEEDAVSSVYMDNGYLFFSVSPVEVKVESDSVDIELRIYEGDQATINNVTIVGNTKTNEHVIRRELRTRPGELFSRSDIIRSVREIANLGHFNAETITPNPIPNQSDGTVDLEYSVEERSSDQLELSGGYGGYYGFVGSLSLKFANFASSDAFKLEEWRPVPHGDGQTLSISFQTNNYYHSLGLSFVEPWLGGKKPTSLSLSVNYTKMENRYTTTDGYFRIIGGAAGIGTRLKWPDDFFQAYGEISYQQYKLQDYSYYTQLSNGSYNLYSIKFVISRSNQDQIIYPRSGSSFSLGVQLTPPFSLFKEQYYWSVSADEVVDLANEYTDDEYLDLGISDDGDLNGEAYFYEDIREQEQAAKFKDIEFHKWTYKSTWYTALAGDLVLALRSEFGYLGYYNSAIGAPPFEKFDMGGSGLSGYNMFGTDIIPLRGYEDGTITPLSYVEGTTTYSDDGNIYSRYFAEFRYPVTLNPSATIYGLAFIEGGNAWSDWDSFNPLDLKRSAGIGVRAYLPMFGLLGVDWGYGFDNLTYGENSTTSSPGFTWHFIIGQEL